jgi:uncharacterized membrane protein YGL010W
MGKIFSAIAKELERRDKDRELLSKKFNSLSLVERNAYEQIVDRNNKIGMTYAMVITIPYAIFYLAVFGLVTLFLFNYNALEQIRFLAYTLVKIWVPLILIGVVLDVLAADKFNKLKRRLLKVK